MTKRVDAHAFEAGQERVAEPSDNLGRVAVGNAESLLIQPDAKGRSTSASWGVKRCLTSIFT